MDKWESSLIYSQHDICWFVPRKGMYERSVIGQLIHSTHQAKRIGRGSDSLWVCAECCPLAQWLPPERDVGKSSMDWPHALFFCIINIVLESRFVVLYRVCKQCMFKREMLQLSEACLVGSIKRNLFSSHHPDLSLVGQGLKLVHKSLVCGNVQPSK